MSGSEGSGRIAFWQRANTFPRVSFPSSVVRSIMLMISFRPQTFDSFFSDRFASDAARSSADTASTPCAISRASPRLRRKTAGEKIGVEATRDSLMGPITLAPIALMRAAPAGANRVDDANLPVGRVVRPEVRKEMTGVTAEHHHFVSRRIECDPPVLTCRGNRVGVHLCPA